MSDFKVKKSSFQSAIQQGATAQASVCMARTRTAAVNKKFQLSALGAWAVAEASTAGNLECELRTFEDGLKGYVTTLEAAGSEISGSLTSARDAVFSAVGASAADADAISRKSGTSAASSCDTAYNDMESLRATASSISSDCSGLENSGGITSALSELEARALEKKKTVNDLGIKIDDFDDAVSKFEATYASKLDADKFVTEKMRSAALSATAANIGGDSWTRIGKNATKLSKNYLSLIGECLKGETTFAWAKGKGGWRASFARQFRKKLSEGTAGLVRNVDEFGHTRPLFTGKGKHAVRSQNRVTIDEIRNGFFKKADDAAEAAGKRGGALMASKGLDAAKGYSKVKIGKGLKAVGRGIGYIGDVIDIIDTGIKAGTAYNKSGGGWQGVAAATGQVVKGVTKIGVGKLVGAAIGAAFGGPVGAVAGMAIGTVLTSWTDELIDQGFSKLGVARI